MNKTHDFKLNMPDYSDVVDIDILNDNFRVIDDALMAGLCEKEYTGNNMGSSDPATRKYAWAPWFEIKNENDFDVQVTDRNFETTITIEAGGTYRKYIVGTYYMNFYVQDQHDVTFRWFTDAETRINEIDPSGGGSVSSVNVTGASGSHIVTSGGPITSSGTIEIDLAEGYSIPQTNKQTSWDGKAADLKAEIDSSTYVLTLQLKDSAGNLIGNERTIDLPLETMVVDGEYDPQTQKIKLELKNGNYVEFSVADLVSGLQTELSASNKLDPDYIDYDASHRAVSDTEKDTWNGKQNAISDLSTIRSGAAAGATAVQPSVMEDALDDKQDSIDGSHKLSSDLVDDTNKTNKFVTSTEKNTWNSKQNALTFDDAPTSGSNNPVKSGGIYTALSGKQDTIDSSHKLSSALVSFSTAQNAALSSGIDSTKVSQISTNQTNILYGLEKIGTNLIKPRDDLPTVVTALPEGLRVQRSNTTSSFAYVKCGTVYLESGKKYALYDATYAPTTKHHYFYVDCGGNGFIELSTPSLTATVQYGTGRTTGTYDIYTRIDANSTVDTISTPIICLESVWKQLEAYTPYGAPNYDLTRLEAEDRAALAEEIDAGAKNKIKYDMAQLAALNPLWIVSGSTIRPSSDTHITFTLNSDMSIRVQSDGSNAQAELCICASAYSSIKAGTYVLSGCPTGGDSSTTYDLRLIEQSSPKKYNADAGLGREITWSAQYSYTCNIMVRANQNIDITFKPMICTKAAFGVSNKFVPFGNDPFYQVPINHNMIYHGRNLGATLTDAQHTALSSGNFTDLYLGDYWTKTVTIPAGTYTGGDGQEVTVPAQTNITLKAVIADFDTFYAGYASTYAGINTHHAAVIVTGFSNVVWNGTNSTAGGYVNSLIHKWLVGSALPQIETWFGSAKVLSHQKLLTNAITGDAASEWAWSSQKISLLSENQMYGSKIWGNSKATNGGYEPGEAFKYLNVFNHIDANLLFGNKNIWLRDIASAVWAAYLSRIGRAYHDVASNAGIAPAALILLS